MAAKPNPIVDLWSEPFWEACRDKRLMVQRCNDTGQCWFPPSPVSPFSPKASWQWTQCSGKGEVVSWVVFHQKYFDGFADELPYNVAMVKLAEGPVLITNVRAPNDQLSIGMAVTVSFEQREKYAVPVFEPEAGHG